MNGTRARLAWALGLVLSAPLRVQATGPDEPAPPAPTAGRLDLRLPPAAARPALAVALPHRPNRTVQLEPRKSVIERGVEGSREALIACQKGAYPGATVAAAGVLVAGGEGQPDHCYRF